jgi:hypothetical protein
MRVFIDHGQCLAIWVLDLHAVLDPHHPFPILAQLVAPHVLEHEPVADAQHPAIHLVDLLVLPVVDVELLARGAQLLSLLVSIKRRHLPGARLPSLWSPLPSLLNLWLTDLLARGRPTAFLFPDDQQRRKDQAGGEGHTRQAAFVWFGR